MCRETGKTPTRSGKKLRAHAIVEVEQSSMEGVFNIGGIFTGSNSGESVFVRLPCAQARGSVSYS